MSYIPVPHYLLWWEVKKKKKVCLLDGLKHMPIPNVPTSRKMEKAMGQLHPYGLSEKSLVTTLA